MRYKERDETKRSIFLKKIEGIPSKDIVYIDESGIDQCLHQPFAWAPRGEKVYGDISGKHFARENFIAGICDKEIIAPFCYQGTCNTQLFNFWISNFLVPSLKKGQIVILDNAAFHKSETTKKLIEDAGCRLIFLPPYSPDFNPIETFWANLKAKIRSLIPSFLTLQQAIDNAFSLLNTNVY